MGEVLTLPGMEGVEVVQSPQERSVEARAVFEGRHGDDVDWLLYWELVGEYQWPWRKAAYITWVVMPRDKREVKTEGEFAVKELGLTSSRLLRKWKADEEFVEFIKRMAQGRLAAARLDIWEALISSASNDNPRNHADRELALKMLKDYTPKSQVYVGPLPENLSEMSVQEKRARLKELRRQEQFGGEAE